jgi:hypothetical protein
MSGIPTSLGTGSHSMVMGVDVSGTALSSPLKSTDTSLEHVAPKFRVDEHLKQDIGSER